LRVKNAGFYKKKLVENVKKEFPFQAANQPTLRTIPESLTDPKISLNPNQKSPAKF